MACVFGAFCLGFLFLVLSLGGVVGAPWYQRLVTSHLLHPSKADDERLLVFLVCGKRGSVVCHRVPSLQVIFPVFLTSSSVTTLLIIISTSCLKCERFC